MEEENRSSRACVTEENIDIWEVDSLTFPLIEGD